MSTTMYIRANSIFNLGKFLGDSIISTRVAELFIKNKPHDRYLLSLYEHNAHNFLWEGLIEKYGIEAHEDKGPRVPDGDMDTINNERFVSREAYGLPYDTYRELYARYDCADRQRTLCGDEIELGDVNIFECLYRGQEGDPVDCVGADSYEHGTIKCNKWSGGNGRVFVSPSETCQKNIHFTYEFWEQVVTGLINRGIGVTVNSNDGFMDSFTHPLYQRVFPAFADLFDVVADHSIVACGNTGTGWVAASTETPLIAMEKNLQGLEYGFEMCGVKSLAKTIREPDVAESVDDILRAVS